MSLSGLAGEGGPPLSLLLVVLQESPGDISCPWAIVWLCLFADFSL